MRLLKLLRLFKIGKFLNTLRDEFEVTPHAANPNEPPNPNQPKPNPNPNPKPSPLTLTLTTHPDHSP